jgi:hypothetical protein
VADHPRPGFVTRLGEDGVVPPRRRTDPEVGRAALNRVREAHPLAPDDLRDAVRYLLEELAARAPGRSVEVRVSPYGAVQCVAGPRHTRGTPPNVVELDPMTWVALAVGGTDWATAVAEGLVQASGERADLSLYLPLV